MNLDQIASILDTQSEAFAEFKARQEQRLDQLELKAARPGAGVFGGTGAMGAEETKAFKAWMRNGQEQKAMSVGSDPAGGYLVPSPIHDSISKALKALSPMRGLARVIDMGEGSGTDFVHSRGGTGAAWTGETGARAETDSPELANINVPLCELYAQPSVTQKLLDDAGFDVEAWLTAELSEVFAETEGAAFISGDGIAKPRGLFTYTTAATADATRAWGTFEHVKSGANGAFHTDQGDKLITLLMKVKPAYRQRASWLMGTEVLEKIRLMKEGTTNRYLFEPSLQAGEPARLMGYPIVIDDRVPALGTGSLSLAFGDIASAYTIVQRQPIRMLRDPYTAKPYVRFYTTHRIGGGAVNFDAVKFLQFAA